jgi:hypothetical protein
MAPTAVTAAMLVLIAPAAAAVIHLASRWGGT